MTLRHVLLARKLLPICACSISVNSTIIGYFSHCLDRVATERERTSSIINIYNLITDFHTASCKKKPSKLHPTDRVLHDSSRQQQRPCGEQVRPWGAATVLPLRCRRPHCAATTTLQSSYCRHVTTPGHGAHFELVKGHAVAWRQRRPHDGQRSCHGYAIVLWEIPVRAPWRSDFFPGCPRSPRGRSSGVTGL